MTRRDSRNWRASSKVLVRCAVLACASGCGGSQEPLNPGLNIEDVSPGSTSSTGGGTLEIGGRAFNDQVVVKIGGVTVSVDEVVSRQRLRVTAPSLMGRIGFLDVGVERGSEMDVMRNGLRVFAELLNFNTFRNFSTGMPPVAAAVADLDSNGAPDLAVAVNSDDGSDGALVLLRALAGGTFADPVTVRSIARPSGIAITDLDLDSRPDVVVSDLANNQALLFRNLGGATFADPVSLATGDAPTAVIITDLNGDNAADIAVANRADNNVSVFEADPNSPGTYPASPLVRSVGPSPTSLAGADIDGNATVDLAVTNGTGGTITILFSRPSGGINLLVLSIGTDAGLVPHSIVVADVDGDGALDLLFTLTHEPSGDGEVGFFRNSGTGGFPTLRLFPVGRRPSALAVGDFRPDGRLDVAVANFETNDVSLLFGSPDPNAVFIEPPTTVSAGGSPAALVSARIDTGDQPDLVVFNSASRDASVLIGSPAGNFTQPATVDLGEAASDLIATDTDGDGRLECVAAIGPSGVALLKRSGTSGFGAPVITPIAGSPTRLAALSSGEIVVAGSDDQQVRVLAPLPDGTFEERMPQPPLPGVPAPGALIVADVNGDQLEDVVLGSLGAGGIQVLRRRLDGGFDPLQPVPAAISCTAIAVADWNGDGRVDLAVSDASTDRVAVLFGLGDGHFALPPLSVPLGAPASTLKEFDANGDDTPDLLVGEAGLHVARVLVATGTGGFVDGTAYPLNSDASRFLFADLNFDGIDDLVAVHESGNSVTLFLGRVDRTFVSPCSFGVGSRPSTAVAYPVDDTLPVDLVVATLDGLGLSLLTNISR